MFEALCDIGKDTTLNAVVLGQITNEKSSYKVGWTSLSISSGFPKRTAFCDQQGYILSASQIEVEDQLEMFF